MRAKAAAVIGLPFLPHSAQGRPSIEPSSEANSAELIRSLCGRAVKFPECPQATLSLRTGLPFLPQRSAQ